MDKALRTGLEEIAARTGVTAEIKMVADFPPQPFEASCVAAVRNAATKLGYSHRDITSGAGHDAVYVARVAPAAMIFTPCIDGISHNESENMTPEWASAGTDVLLHAVLEKAEVVGGKA
jgi:N-carbamoyl-L-amino-acid hydrolase